MKRLFVWGLMLLLTQLARAQVTQLPDRLIYRGADYSFNLVIPRSDSALVASATLLYDPAGSVLPMAQQPTLSRSGRTLGFAWTAAQTAAMRDAKFWLEIKAGTSVRFAAWVIASKAPTSATSPGSLTVVSPIAEPLNVLPPYRLNGVGPSGFRITHGRGTPLIKATFYRDDTGRPDRYRPDGLWSIAIISDNTVEVTGPPGELFSGYLQLEPIPISNQ